MRVAIVGCGGIGATHARAYKEIDGVEIEAFVDLDLNAAESHAAQFGGEAAGSVEAVVGRVDAASVTTPPHRHFEVTRRLLEAGIHVFSEKPLTMDPKQGAELLALATGRSLVLMTGFKMRFEPVFAKARELAPLLGPIRHLSTLKMQPFAPREKGEWRPVVGAMYELSVHDFDLIHWICRMRPVAVHSAKLDYQFGWQREDGFSAIVEYDSGATGCLSGSYQRHAKWIGRDFTLCVGGENGYMRVERPDRICMHLDQFDVHEVDPASVQPFVEEIRNFCDAVTGRAEALIEADAGLVTASLVEAIVMSANQGRRVVLDEMTSGLGEQMLEHSP